MLIVALALGLQAAADPREPFCIYDETIAQKIAPADIYKTCATRYGWTDAQAVLAAKVALSEAARVEARDRINISDVVDLKALDAVIEGMSPEEKAQVDVPGVAQPMPTELIAAILGRLNVTDPPALARSRIVLIVRRTLALGKDVAAFRQARGY